MYTFGYIIQKGNTLWLVYSQGVYYCNFMLLRHHFNWKKIWVSIHQMQKYGQQNLRWRKLEMDHSRISENQNVLVCVLVYLVDIIWTGDLTKTQLYAYNYDAYFFTSDSYESCSVNVSLIQCSVTWMAPKTSDHALTFCGHSIDVQRSGHFDYQLTTCCFCLCSWTAHWQPFTARSICETNTESIFLALLSTNCH